jgi:hypothetical protein
MRKISLNWPDSVPKDQISEQFLQGMLDRMAFGFHNYGHVKLNANRNYDVPKSLRLRMKKYRLTRNTEFLMDVANFAMMEFMQPKYRGATFTPTTKRESPGAVTMTGKIRKGKDECLPA